MQTNQFSSRHNGLGESDIQDMLKSLNVNSLQELIKQIIPQNIQLQKELELPDAMTESEYLGHISSLGNRNESFRSFIGMGYYTTHTPMVLVRNILENPSWYTSYTPYQAEISQGRLEALLNFQTIIADLTGLPIANCSLLDESTAAAEAARMMFELRSRAEIQEGKNVLWIDTGLFPQHKVLIRSRMQFLNIQVLEGTLLSDSIPAQCFGAILQAPAANGDFSDYSELGKQLQAAGVRFTVIADILSLALFKEPGVCGADIAVGSTQRFGLPMYFGGPSAGYMACKDEYKRNLPGRIIGVSTDRLGKPALRMALQTREQHIKREKATSNICTAQALMAILSGMYGVFHGPDGIKEIAQSVFSKTFCLAKALKEAGYRLASDSFFDTLQIEDIDAASIRKAAEARRINLYYPSANQVRLSLDEQTDCEDLKALAEIFGLTNFRCQKSSPDAVISQKPGCGQPLRTSSYMQQTVFKAYHSETDLMRYIKTLEKRDISLTDSMIALGSCTMKLNAAATLNTLSNPNFANLHPLVPREQAAGYIQLIDELGKMLCSITGMKAISFQPNSGANGEYAGLLSIRHYQISKGEIHRNIALIPASAHGTNPASAALAGLNTVVVACDDLGNIRLDDLKAKIEMHSDHISCLMITYPSTHGVFESEVRQIVSMVHQAGAQVYMDGANMNAQVGYTSPGYIGADVCHLNLHKTFAMPHGGGGPGVGPICVAEHLVPFLPQDPALGNQGDGCYAVAGALFGSAGLLPITYAYLRMMGLSGLKDATAQAILNANYLSKALSPEFETLYTGTSGRVAHECIIDLRHFKKTYGVDATDVAKRLMDYGFHAPTLSFPVVETLMIEPTESESKAELDRFVFALKSILKECENLSGNNQNPLDNVLKMAPFTAQEVCSDVWEHPFSRQAAAYPAPWLQNSKYWPHVSRVDNGTGDRNLIPNCNEFFSC